MNNDSIILHWALDALVGSKGRGLTTSELSTKITEGARRAIRRGEYTERDLMTYNGNSGGYWEITGTKISNLLARRSKTDPNVILIGTYGNRRYWGLQSEIDAVVAENEERALRNKRVQILDRSDWDEDKAEVLVVLDGNVVAIFGITYTRFEGLVTRLTIEVALKQAEALARELRRSLV